MSIFSNWLLNILQVLGIYMYYIGVKKQKENYDFYLKLHKNIQTSKVVR